MSKSDPRKERTVILLKPDALQRNLFGNIVSRFEKKGLKLISLKMISIGDTMIEEHYEHHVKKPFFSDLKSYMQSSPVVGMVWQGVEVVKIVRHLVGATSGREADIGTIRGDLSNSTSRNIIHASDSVETAEIEVKRFFKEEEIFDWEKQDLDYVYAPDE